MDEGVFALALETVTYHGRCLHLAAGKQHKVQVVRGRHTAAVNRHQCLADQHGRYAAELLMPAQQVRQIRQADLLRD